MLYGVIAGAEAGFKVAVIPVAAALQLSGITPTRIVATNTSLQPSAGNLAVSSAPPTKLILVLSPNLVPAARNLSLSADVPSVGNWVLVTAFWDDGGQWIDAAAWVD
jgi:hypothetical protein